VPHNIYAAVQNTLTNPANANAQPLARWSLGTYNTVITGYTTNGNPPTAITTRYPIPTGDYHIQINSPGSGTLIADSSGNLFAHPNAYHAFV
jgi:hypothetical protein